MRCSIHMLLGHTGLATRPGLRCVARRPSGATLYLRRCARHRGFSVEAVSTILLPPAVFCGLMVTLWTYKCMMMVIFQNKIIYMPSVPPFSRAEKVEDYAIQCRPVVWEEHAIKSIDGTNIKLLEGSIPDQSSKAEVDSKNIIVLYFQGNASSLPPRLPYLSRVLRTVSMDRSDDKDGTRYKIVALSYRGFWSSSGKASQPGIELDAAAALKWVFNRYQGRSDTILLWGQSIGAGAASVALANLAKANTNNNAEARLSRISGLLLETPFTNLRAMLIALYPQKFLPYRYLAPFLRSTWDSTVALTTVGDAAVMSSLRVLILQAGDDELVPSDNAATLEELCRAKGLEVERVVVKGALHTEVMAKLQGRNEITKFLRSFK